MAEKENTYCNCLYYSANALARVVTKMAEEAFSVVDLPPSYAFIVMTVNRKPGLCAGELAKIMMLSPSTVTRLVEKLETRHLVKKHTDGRTTMIYPTPDSVAVNDAIKSAWYMLYQRITAILGEEGSKELTGKIYNAALILEQK